MTYIMALNLSIILLNKKHLKQKFQKYQTCKKIFITTKIVTSISYPKISKDRPLSILTFHLKYSYILIDLRYKYTLSFELNIYL